MKKKNNIFIKKQIQNLFKKKKINFKLEKNLKLLKIIKILSNNSIIVFSQFLSLDSEKNWEYYLKLYDKKYNNILLSYSFIIKFFDNKILLYLKNFNNIFCIKNLYDIDKISKETNILILGYFFNNIFFWKKDFNVKKIKKINILNKLKKVKNHITNICIKIILLSTFKFKKLILLGKNGNNKSNSEKTI